MKKTLFIITGLLAQITFAADPQPAAPKVAPAPVQEAHPTSVSEDLPDLGSSNIPSTGYGIPSASLTSPNALGDGYGVFGSFNYINHWNGNTTKDTGLNFGGSFGDPHRYVGGVVSLNTDPSDGSGNNAGLSFRINRYFKENTAVAVGIDNLIGWGLFSSAAKGYYGALTHRFPLSIPITLNSGIGTGSFFSSTYFIDGKDGSVRPFAGIGIGPFRNVTLLADYTANVVSAGANYDFNLMSIPLFANAGILNLNKYQDNSMHFQFGFGAAYPF